jgi:ketosteroid isomerase-like protein
MIDRRLVLSGLVAAFAAPALAHPHDTLTNEQMGHIEHQILHMREALQKAIAAKDVARLRAIYAASFSHTHGSGKVDGRDARIVSVLAGEPTIEMAKVSELSIRVPNADTAIVAGKSPIRSMADGKDYDFRWLQVWARVGGDWQLVASQATRLPVTS